MSGSHAAIPYPPVHHLQGQIHQCRSWHCFRDNGRRLVHQLLPSHHRICIQQLKSTLTHGTTSMIDARTLVSYSKLFGFSATNEECVAMGSGIAQIFPLSYVTSRMRMSRWPWSRCKFNISCAPRERVLLSSRYPLAMCVLSFAVRNSNGYF